MRMKRKVQKKNSTTESEAPSTAASSPYEVSVLVPRTKWRAVVLPRGSTQMATQSELTYSHDAILSGMFRGADEKR